MTPTTVDAPSFAQRYRVIQSRDRRFDGQFVTAVRSTGIYCRPSCPARTPKEANVTFYDTSAAAHEAGYRACKRCVPEAAPGSPLWDVRGDVVARAMRLIADGVVDREGVPGLARRLGYSSRHLTRVLTAELGAGPLALARAHRAHTARALLVGTDLSSADVAFSAGFHSIRQFTDTIGEVFGMPPRDLRARRSAATTGAAAGEIDLALPVRGPIDTVGLFGWMRAHAIPGVETGTDRAFARVCRLPTGPGWFEVRLADDGRLRLRARLTALADLGTLIARVRRLFDLDADPLAVDQALSRHPALAPAVAAIPGVRVPGAVDADEMLLRAMIGQQISVASARTMQGRLAAELGEPVGVGPEPLTLFPEPAVIAERGLEVLRGPAARMRAIVEAAAALADGTLQVSPGDDGAEQRERLLAMRGIGPWTADYVRMRVLGDPDVLLPGDVAARAGAAALGVPSDPAGFTAWSERAAPWRSYAMAHFWYAAPVTQAWRSPAEAAAAATLSRPRRASKAVTADITAGGTAVEITRGGAIVDVAAAPSAFRTDGDRQRLPVPSAPVDVVGIPPRPRKRDFLMTTATLQFVDTPDGAFAILADDADRVVASGWTADTDALLARLRPERRPATVVSGETVAARAVRSFYAGDIAAIDTVEVAQHGTALQMTGWQALRRIAPGQPLTYTGFAAALGSPAAVRAAASICARNAVALFVPCHRVLRGDGTMGGFAWGTTVKESLLAREAHT